MQFLRVSETTTLSDLADTVGDRNVDPILNANNLTRCPKVGTYFKTMCDEVINKSTFGDGKDDWKRKVNILNTFTKDSDIFEAAALASSSDWKVLNKLGTFPNMLKIPESITLPDSVDILGNSSPIPKGIYDKTMVSLQNNNSVDPSIFNEYSTIKPSKLVDMSGNNNGAYSVNNPIQWFKLPWAVTLFSSLDGDSKDFPVYPLEIGDERRATYDTMPDMIYQYEPWQVYTSSGPRSNTYEFDMHRDMWTGNHTDGKCNELIRFCEANCYPDYNGSSVNTSTVTLYIQGKAHITGVMTNVSTKWDGPIGTDGYYLHCVLQITITEVSEEALNYNVVKNKGLIG